MLLILIRILWFVLDCLLILFSGLFKDYLGLSFNIEIIFILNFKVNVMVNYIINKNLNLKYVFLFI